MIPTPIIILIIVYVFQLACSIITLATNDDIIFNTKKGFLISLIPYVFLYRVIAHIVKKYKLLK